MATLRLYDNGIPPFGAEVYNSRQQQLGIVGDNGSVYLIGINPGERLQVNWDGKTQCEAVLPDPLPDDLFNSLLLPCVGNASPQPDTLSSRNPTH